MPCVCFDAQRQKLEAVLEENDDELLAYPAWVVSDAAGKLWEQGVEPPTSLQLSRAAAAEIVRLRKWAEATLAQRQPQLSPQLMPLTGPRPRYRGNAQQPRGLSSRARLRNPITGLRKARLPIRRSCPSLR